MIFNYFIVVQLILNAAAAFIDLYIKGKLSTLSTLDSSTPWLKEAGENCKPVYRSSTIILLPVMIILDIDSVEFRKLYMFSVLYAARITMLRSMYSVAAVETAAMKIPSYVLGLEEKKKKGVGDE